MLFIAITNVDYVSLKLLYDAVVFTSLTVRECIEVWCSSFHFKLIVAHFISIKLIVAQFISSCFV